MYRTCTVFPYQCLSPSTAAAAGAFASASTFTTGTSSSGKACGTVSSANSST